MHNNKAFVFVNDHPILQSGGNIYNAEIAKCLQKNCHKVHFEENVYCPIPNKTSIVILDSIILNENFQLDFWHREDVYFLIHLWPSRNADLSQEMRQTMVDLQRQVCRHFKLIFAGRHAYNQCKEFYNEPLMDYIIIPPGVSDTWKKKDNYNQTAYKFLSIGNLCNRKRQLEIVKCFTNLNVELTLLGRCDDENYLQDIKTWIAEHSMTNVSLMNECDYFEINKVICDHDAVILFSEEENNSMALIEASASQCPFISSPTGNYLEYVDKKIGIVLKDFEISSLEEAVKEMSTNESYYKESIKSVSNLRLNTWQMSAAMFSNLAS